ncbi:hypothetical protein JB92DRAFT_3112489 [Gautieria morchelliformis]|nr:hypothetical protein JB92DRAFT_3112489 [Gautieria morchelliformis]
MAFLRTMLQENPKDYWKEVDSKLRQWEEEYPTKELSNEQMIFNLQLDQEDYLRPATNKLVPHPTIATKDLESWQLACDRHAGKAGTEGLPRKAKAKPS